MGERSEGTAPVRIRPARSGDGARAGVALALWMDPALARRLAPDLTAQGPIAAFVADAPDGSLAGFVEAMVSEIDPTLGYVHFVWVSPELRGMGIAARLYDAVFAALRELGCLAVAAVVSQRSATAIAFHRAMGFHPAEGTGLDVEPGPMGGSQVHVRPL